MLPDAGAALDTLAERMQGAVAHEAALVGIYSGGAWLAERLASRLPGAHPLGFIDVSYYRDDYALSGLKPNARRTTLPFDVSGATIVLIDDVLYTGRRVRAAINELFDYGRPASVKLAVLVDRGGRELPMQPDYAAARVTIPASQSLELARDGTGKFSFKVEGR
jgi:pyrimidine operon attenuation protein/uracil phosphoribosyltransferase